MRWKKRENFEFSLGIEQVEYLLQLGDEEKYVTRRNGSNLRSLDHAIGCFALWTSEKFASYWFCTIQLVKNTIAWMENFKIQTVTRDSDLLSTSFIMKKNSLIWCRLQIIKHRYLRLVVGSCVTTGFRRLLHVRTNPFLSREPSECRRMRAWLDIVWNFSSTEMKGKNCQTTKIQMASAVLFFSVFRHHSWNLLRST